MTEYPFDEDALNMAEANFSHVQKAIQQQYGKGIASITDDGASLANTEKAIRAILSLPDSVPIPARPEEVDLFRHIVGVMNKLNKQWLKMIQVAYPFGLTRNSQPPRDGTLQERFEPSTEKDGVISRSELRSIFFEMVSCCLSNDDRLGFLHGYLIRLSSRSKLPDHGTSAVIAEALISEMQGFMDMEVARLYALPPLDPSQEDFAVAAVRANYTRISKGFEAALQYTPAWHGLCPLPEEFSEDTLFCKVLLNATLNKTLLENWGMEAKAREALLLQTDLLERIQEEGIEGGIDDAVSEYTNDGSVDYVELCHYMLGTNTEERAEFFSPNVIARIRSQVDAIMKSHRLDQFEGELALNAVLQSQGESRQIMEAWSWLVLMYSRLQGIGLDQKDPAAHGNLFFAATNKGKSPAEAGEVMTTLRRLVSSLAFAHHTFDFCPERQKAHFDFVQDVRFQKLETLQRILRRNSSYTWKELYDRLAGYRAGPCGPDDIEIEIEI